jgi:hypothetical protein
MAGLRKVREDGRIERIASRRENGHQAAAFVEQVFLKIPGDGTVQIAVFRSSRQPAIHRMGMRWPDTDFSRQGERHAISRTTKAAYLNTIAGLLPAKVVARKAYHN